MKLIKPIEITSTVYSSSTVLENDYSNWNTTSAYTTGAFVMVTSKWVSGTSTTIHHVYEALGNNTAVYPPDSTSAWLDLGATNRWKMFDTGYQTQTEGTSSIQVSLMTGRANSVGILNVDASTVRVQVKNGATSVYDSGSVNLNITEVTDWYEYFFSPIERMTDKVFTDLPRYTSAELIVTLASASGVAVKCGLVLPGDYVNLGESQWGVALGIADYSIKELDDFGNYAITERTYHDTVEVDVVIETPRVSYVKRVLSDYRATPALYVPSEAYPVTMLYGYYKDFSIILPNPTLSKCAIELEGLN